jgi:DNA-binding NtrC family response regulator
MGAFRNNFELPPLHERSDDIPLLVDHFIKEFGHTNRNIQWSRRPLV